MYIYIYIYIIRHKDIGSESAFCDCARIDLLKISFCPDTCLLDKPICNLSIFDSG